MAYRISPPMKGMSVPGRSAQWMSALAEVRVKRGSTWMTGAPRSLALAIHRKATGCVSATLLPMIRMASLLAKSIQ